MKILTQLLLIVVLLVVYATTLVAFFHPNVTPKYHAYFIDHTLSEWSPKHYSSDPEQGMHFSKAGLPDWVDGVYGFSFREDWGRWTDGFATTDPSIAFTQPFTGQICVYLVAGPAPALVGKSVSVRMGKETETLPFAGAEPKEYRIPFHLTGEASRLEFVMSERPPREIDFAPNNNDTRRLGIAMSYLAIRRGSCADTTNAGGKPQLSVKEK